MVAYGKKINSNEIINYDSETETVTVDQFDLGSRCFVLTGVTSHATRGEAPEIWESLLITYTAKLHRICALFYRDI